MSGVTDSEAPPVAAVRARRVSLAWVVPLAAVLLVGVLVVTQATRARGPTITVRFDDAAGLVPGAEVVHRGLGVGVVRTVRPTEDLSGVVVTAELAPEAAGLGAEGTLFWVVRPEVSLRGVSGLDTLIGPRYLAVRPGPADAPRRSSFEGLPGPPLASAASGDALRLTLRTSRLGGLSPGSPVLYREVRVGTLRGAELAPDATGVLVRIEIEPRFSPLVRENSRFWRVGSVGVDFGLFRGLTVRADSLDQFVTGGVAFATPDRPGAAPSPDAIFSLADEPESAWLSWTPSIDLAPRGQGGEP